MFDLSALLQIDFLMVFMEGLLSFFSPCVIPLLPLYMSYLAGKDKNERTRKRTILFTFSFIIGIFTAIFLMHISIQTIQYFFQSYLYYITRIGGIIIIILGLYQIGFVKFTTLSKTFRLPFKNKEKMSFLGAFLLGFTFSFAWTPCIGPALSSILLFAASSSNFVYSSFLVFVYALGFVIPFLLLGLFTNQAFTFIEKNKRLLKYTQKIAAIILIIIGLIMFTGYGNTFSSYLNTSVSKDKVSEATKKDTNSVLKGLDQNGNQIAIEDYKGKVVFVNFWATWCPPCQHELPDVQKLYEKYKDSDEVQILSIVKPNGQEKSKSGIIDYLDEHSYNFPVLFDEDSIYYEYAIQSMPTTIMFDKEGKPYGKVSGALQYDMMESIIEQTLNANK